MADWLERAKWIGSAELGPLDQYQSATGERVVVMQVRCPGIADQNLLWPLWKRWLSLPRHENVLEAVAPSEGTHLLARYAAINWETVPLAIDLSPVATTVVATWGVELTRAFEKIRACIVTGDLGWLACTFAKVDMQGAVRMGFVNPAGSEALMHRTAPEVIAAWPHADERALVFAIAQLLLGFIEVTPATRKTPLGALIERCLARDPMDRVQSLEKLREALIDTGGRWLAWRADKPDVWTQIELGVGYSQLGLKTRALHHFRRALILDPWSDRAREGCDAMIEQGADPERAAGKQWITFGRTTFGPTPVESRPWSVIQPQALALEQVGDYRGALALYYRVYARGAGEIEVQLAFARSHLGVRELGQAVDYATRVLSREPQRREAHAVLTEALHLRKQPVELLAACDAWIGALPDDAAAHYQRAKALLALGKLADAHAACGRATVLAPTHLPALMLGWQIERSMKRVRVTAGEAAPMPLDLPEHLRGVRDLLVAGQTAAAIALLERPEYAADGAAQLLHGELLAFCEQLEAALAGFERAATLGSAYVVPARLGQATVLVRLGRAEDALGLCDELAREHPDVSELHEARAFALQALGRTAEAEEAFKRAVAADAQRTQMRVKLGGR